MRTSPYFKKQLNFESTHRTKKSKNINRSPYFSDALGKSDVKDKPTNNVCRGCHVTISYHPPPSPFNLIQESLFGQPWQLLVATIFLNKTSGKQAIPRFWQFVERFPQPEDVTKDCFQQIADLMQPLGLSERRAENIIRFTHDYLNKKWKYPKELYGIGKYGDDSYRIFCLGQWHSVEPDDRKLNLYHRWLIHQYQIDLVD